MINAEFVIKNKYFKRDRDLWKTLFDGKPTPVKDVDMYDLLVISGIFKSRSQAKKNWIRTGKEIPEGWSYFEKIGKLNNSLTVLNSIFVDTTEEDKRDRKYKKLQLKEGKH